MSGNDSRTRIAEINSYIDLAKNRQLGLCKLVKFLEGYSLSSDLILIEKNCQFWLKTIFTIIENQEESFQVKLAYYAVYLVFQIIKHLSPDINRIISTQYIEKAVTLFTRVKIVQSRNAFMCLNELLSGYRVACSQFKPKIEKFILTGLDSDSNEIILWSSICYSRIPCLHRNMQNTNETWPIYFLNMLRTANEILDVLFENDASNSRMDTSGQTNDQNNGCEIDELNNSRGKFDNELFNIFPKDSITRDENNMEEFYTKYSLRFKACCLCLSNMFKNFNDRIQLRVKPKLIINFLKRIVMFEYNYLVEKSRIDVSSRFLMSIMPDIYSHSLKLVGDFFDILKTNMLPHSLTINKYMEKLGRTLNDFKVVSALPSYYECLTKWFVAVGSGSDFFKFSPSFIEKLIQNIREEQREKINLEDSRSKNSAKQTNNLQLSAFQLKKHKELIQSELKCLRTYFEVFSHKLAAEEIMHIVKSLIDLVYSVQYNSAVRKPYDQEDSRLVLYATFKAVCLCKTVKITTPIPICVNIFKNALNDSSLDIKDLAQNTLRILRAYTYPNRSTFIREYSVRDQHEARLTETATNLEKKSNQLDIGQLVESLQQVHQNIQNPETIHNETPFQSQQSHLDYRQSIGDFVPLTNAKPVSTFSVNQLSRQAEHDVYAGKDQLRLNLENGEINLVANMKLPTANNLDLNHTSSKKRELSESEGEESMQVETGVENSINTKAKAYTAKQQHHEKIFKNMVKKSGVGRSDDDDDDIIDLDEGEDGEDDYDDEEEDEEDFDDEEDIDDEEEDDEADELDEAEEGANANEMDAGEDGEIEYEDDDEKESISDDNDSDDEEKTEEGRVLIGKIELPPMSPSPENDNKLTEEVVEKNESEEVVTENVESVIEKEEELVEKVELHVEKEAAPKENNESIVEAEESTRLEKENVNDLAKNPEPQSPEEADNQKENKLIEREVGEKIEENHVAPEKQESPPLSEIPEVSSEAAQ